jgi:hypothetical protein
MTWSLQVANISDAATFSTKMWPSDSEVRFLRIFAQWPTSRPFEVVDPGVSVLGFDSTFRRRLAESMPDKCRIDIDVSYLRIEHDVVDETIVDISSHINDIIDGASEFRGKLWLLARPESE